MSNQSIDISGYPRDNRRYDQERPINSSRIAFDLDTASESSPPRNVMMDEPVNMANQLYSSGQSFY